LVIGFEVARVARRPKAERMLDFMLRAREG
jgi:hypothetical protein